MPGTRGGGRPARHPPSRFRSALPQPIALNAQHQDNTLTHPRWAKAHPSMWRRLSSVPRSPPWVNAMDGSC